MLIPRRARVKWRQARVPRTSWADPRYTPLTGIHKQREQSCINGCPPSPGRGSERKARSEGRRILSPILAKPRAESPGTHPD